MFAQQRGAGPPGSSAFRPSIAFGNPAESMPGTGASSTMAFTVPVAERQVWRRRLQPGCSKNLTCGRKAPTTTCKITIVCSRGCLPASVRLLETLGRRRPFPACARIRQLATVTAKSNHGASTHARKKARFASVSDHDVNAAAETSTAVSNPPFSATFGPLTVYGKPAELVPGVGASAIVAVYHDGGWKCVWRNRGRPMSSRYPLSSQTPGWKRRMKI